jgi:hypothetical protein
MYHLFKVSLMKLQIRKKKVKKSCQVQTPLKYKAQQDFQRQEKKQVELRTQKYLNIKIPC